MTLRSVFKFKGRATRFEYWIVFGTTIFIGVVALVLAELVFEIPILSQESSTHSFSEAALYFSISLGIVLVMLPVTLRRLHDRNRGFIWLVFYTVGGFLFDVIDVDYLSSLNLPPMNQYTTDTLYGIGGLITVFPSLI